MEKLFIKNRKEQKIAVVLEIPEDPKGLAFVMHGLGGYKEQPHVQTFAKAFTDNGYSTVLFDTTNTLGESDGNYEDATTTNYYEDLEDVIAWAKTQDFYIEPFCLCGHSLGGISTALYAEKHPDQVKAVAPISTVVSGQLTVDATPKEELEEWRSTGWKISKSNSKPGVIKKLKWSHIPDRLKYDLIPMAENLAMPVLLITGSEDKVTPPEHQKILFDALPGKKELHIIQGGPHTFKAENHLKEIYEIFDKWIKSLN